MLPCACAVILTHFDVFCDLLLKRLMATWNLFVLYTVQWPEKKADKHTCLEPLDCSRNCASLGIFKSQTLLFVSASSFFFILLVSSFFEKIFNVFTCSKRNNDEHIIFEEQRVCRSDDTRWQLLWSFLAVYRHEFGHSQCVKNSFCLRFSIFRLCE